MTQLHAATSKRPTSEQAVADIAWHNHRHCVTHHLACDCREAKFAELAAENAAMRNAVRELRECMGEMMPFIMEDYYPAYASLDYKTAVEKMKSALTKTDHLT